jgi:hypothetical protein
MSASVDFAARRGATMTIEPEELRNHHSDTAKKIVQRWIPGADVYEDKDTDPGFNGVGWYVSTQAYGFPVARTEQLAWEAAYMAMLEVAAYYVWQQEGSPIPGSSVADWKTAQAELAEIR